MDMDKAHTDMLDRTPYRCEIVVQWMQTFMTNGLRHAILDIPPPILSRAFQEIAIGMLALAQARKLTEIHFPYPFAQIHCFLLIIHGFIGAVHFGLTIAPHWAFFLTFVITTMIWCIYFTALELERPYGDDWNDCPVEELHMQFNETMIDMMDELVRCPPTFSFPDEQSFELHLEDHAMACPTIEYGNKHSHTKDAAAPIQIQPSSPRETE